MSGKVDRLDELVANWAAKHWLLGTVLAFSRVIGTSGQLLFQSGASDRGDLEAPVKNLQRMLNDQHQIRKHY